MYQIYLFFVFQFMSEKCDMDKEFYLYQINFSFHFLFSNSWVVDSKKMEDEKRIEGEKSYFKMATCKVLNLQIDFLLLDVDAKRMIGWRRWRKRRRWKDLRRRKRREWEGVCPTFSTKTIPCINIKKIRRGLTSSPLCSSILEPSLNLTFC